MGSEIVRVAVGLQKVAQASAHRAHVPETVERIVGHGMEVLASCRVAARAALRTANPHKEQHQQPSSSSTKATHAHSSSTPRADTDTSNDGIVQQTQRKTNEERNDANKIIVQREAPHESIISIVRERPTNDEPPSSDRTVPFQSTVEQSKHYPSLSYTNELSTNLSPSSSTSQPIELSLAVPPPIKTDESAVIPLDASQNPMRMQPDDRNDGTAIQSHPAVLQGEGTAVPSTRVERALGFAQLGLGLAWGTVAEGTRQFWGRGTSRGGNDASPSASASAVLNDANADRLAASLCRMRGAALKMGQMLSIQDETLLPPALSRALVQVRQGADAMPAIQLNRQLKAQLGEAWRERFVDFEMHPFAAASIGQVHRATILPTRATTSTTEAALAAEKPLAVVVKVQYPGVAQSIESDLRNLSMLVKWSGLAPPGLFLENVIRVGQDELTVECDYRIEIDNQRRMKALVESDDVLRENQFTVPAVVTELSTDEILVSEFVPGGTIDKIAHLASQAERNRIGRSILYLTMKELFDWRFMQTDPNWGNFLYDVHTRTTGLIDFGATREYDKSFVDGYLRIVWASANRDEQTLLEQSMKMGFLTGKENASMLRAHTLSGFTVGEPFALNYSSTHGKDLASTGFDFRESNISSRMGEHTSVFLKHRLTPPPEEVYTLHRKLAGAYMLCIKLGAVVSDCRSMLESIVAQHDFQDGIPNPISGR